MTQQQPDEKPQQDDHADQGEQLVLTSPEDARTPKDFALWGGVILLAALTIYAPALRGELLWDDDRHISLNRNLRDFPGLVNIWTKLGPKSGGTIQYYPLTHTTFWLEYKLSGATPTAINTTVFHITNVVLHVIGAILLWLVLRELKAPGSWVVAAIWALHPLQVESVAWMSERKNVLAGVFFFGSILAYLRAAGLHEERAEPTVSAEAPHRHEEPTPVAATPLSYSSLPPKTDVLIPSLYALSIVLYACALLSKTMSASVPAVLLVLLWWKGRLTTRHVL